MAYPENWSRLNCVRRPPAWVLGQVGTHISDPCEYPVQKAMASPSASWSPPDLRPKPTLAFLYSSPRSRRCVCVQGLTNARRLSYGPAADRQFTLSRPVPYSLPLVRSTSSSMFPRKALQSAECSTLVTKRFSLDLAHLWHTVTTKSPLSRSPPVSDQLTIRQSPLDGAALTSALF